MSAAMMQVQGAARGYVLAPLRFVSGVLLERFGGYHQRNVVLRNLTADNPHQQDASIKLQPSVTLG